MEQSAHNPLPETDLMSTLILRMFKPLVDEALKPVIANFNRCVADMERRLDNIAAAHAADAIAFDERLKSVEMDVPVPGDMSALIEKTVNRVIHAEASKMGKDAVEDFRQNHLREDVVEIVKEAIDEALGEDEAIDAHITSRLSNEDFKEVVWDAIKDPLGEKVDDILRDGDEIRSAVRQQLRSICEDGDLVVSLSH